jgi:rare lipoprotein A
VRPCIRRGALMLGVTVLGFMLMLAGCGGSPKKGEVRLDQVAGAKPRAEPKAKYGNMRSYVVFGKTYYPKASSRNFTERGIASWYGPKFHGKKTSSGEIYDMHQMTAAHKTLPLPTYALVTNLENGRNLIVKVNDRGPFVGDRIIDLSYAAAKHLGVDRKGLARVQVTSIDPRDHDGEPPKSITVARAELDRYRAGAATKTSAPTPSGSASTRTSSRSSSSTASVEALSPASPIPVPASEPALAIAQEPPMTPAAADPEPVRARPAVAQTQGGYSLQVGAFGTRKNADQMRRRLQGQFSAPVTVDAPEGSGAPLYRVRVGPVGSRSDAERLSGQLVGLGIGPSLVVPH